MSKEERFEIISQFNDEESTVLFLDAITSIENREVRETLLAMTFMSLAEIDPPKTMDFFNGLKLEYQDIVIEAIFSKVTLSDLEDCLKHIQHLDRYQEERAVLAFLNSTENLDYESLIDIAKLSIYAATPFIAEIKDGKQQFELTDEITEHWAKQDLNATSEMITNYHHLTRDDFMLTSMTHILAIESPREAVNIVGKYFGEYGADMEIRIFETIFEHQPNEGLLLLSHVRQDLLDWQIRRFADIIFKVSPEQAVEFGYTVPEREKEDYFEWLKRDFCYSETNMLVNLIDRIPIPKIASESAACLISEAIHEGKYMTQDDYGILFKYLLKDELKWIEKYDISKFLSD